MVQVRLLRPLDGKDIGDTAEYPEVDAKRLEVRGAVKILGAKAEPAPANKAEPAPTNKATAPRRAKKKAS